MRSPPGRRCACATTADRCCGTCRCSHRCWTTGTTYLSVGQREVGRDETVAFAQRLAGAGVPTELHLYPGAWHGFEVKAPRAAVSHASLTAQVAALRRALAGRARSHDR